MGVVIDKHFDIMHRMVGLVGTEVVSTKCVVVLEAGVVVLLSVVCAMVFPVMLPCIVVVMVAKEVPVVLVVVTIMVLVMLVIEVSFVAIVMVLTSSETMQKIANMAFIQMMLMVLLCSGCMMSLLFHSALFFFSAGLVFVWSHSKLLLVVFVIIVSLV